MSVWLALLHLLNFIAPAAGMAVFLALGEVASKRKWPSLLDAASVLAVYFLAGVGALMLGLALLSRDGKMLTYAALLLVQGSLAAWRTRG